MLPQVHELALARSEQELALMTWTVNGPHPPSSRKAARYHAVPSATLPPPIPPASQSAELKLHVLADPASVKPGVTENTRFQDWGSGATSKICALAP